MPWCPVCKSEYRSNFTLCADCNIPLVDSLEEAPKAIIFGEKEVLLEMNEFLSVNGITEGFVAFDEDEKTDELFVPDEDMEEAKKIITVFLKQKELEAANSDENTLLEAELEELAQLEESELNSEEFPAQSSAFPFKKAYEADTVYIAKKEKATEYKTSAQTLLLVGIAGILLLILNAIGVITIPIGETTKYMIYFVIGGMFIIFIVVGLHSMKLYKHATLDAVKEESLISHIKKFLSETVSAESFSKEEETQSAASDEELYFSRIEKIKAIILESYPEIDHALLEKLSDDHYTELFG